MIDTIRSHIVLDNAEWVIVDSKLVMIYHGNCPAEQVARRTQQALNAAFIKAKCTVVDVGEDVQIQIEV